MLGAAGLAGGFGGLLASGFLRLGSVGSVSSGGFIFLVERVLPDALNKGACVLTVFQDNISWLRYLIHLVLPWRPSQTWNFTCNQITVQGLSIYTAKILRLNFPKRSLVQIQLSLRRHRVLAWYLDWCSVRDYENAQTWHYNRCLC